MVMNLSAEEIFPEPPICKSTQEYKQLERRYNDIFLEEYLNTTDDILAVQSLVKQLHTQYFDRVERWAHTDAYFYKRYVKAQKYDNEKILKIWNELKSYATHNNYNAINPYGMYLLSKSAYDLDLLVDQRGLKPMLSRSYKNIRKIRKAPLQKMLISQLYVKYNLFKVKDRKPYLDMSVGAIKIILKKHPEFIRSCYWQLMGIIDRCWYIRIESFGGSSYQPSQQIKDYEYLLQDSKWPKWFNYMLKGNLLILKSIASYNNKSLSKSLNYDAREQYNLAKDFYPQNPESLVKLMLHYKDVAFDESSLEEIGNSQIDHPEFYSAFFKHNWNLSDSDRMEFAYRCFKKRGFNSFVPMLLHYVFIDQNIEKFDISKCEKHYDSLRELYEHNIKLAGSEDFYSDKDKNYYLTLKLALAIKFKKFAHLQEALKEMNDIGSGIDMHALQEYKVDLEEGAAYSYALAENVDYEIYKLIQEYYKEVNGAKDFKKLRGKFNEIKTIVDNLESSPFIDHLGKLLENHDKYTRGDWVDLNFTPHFFGMNVIGDWNYISDETVELNCVREFGRNHLFIRDTEAYPYPYEIEVEVEEINAFNRIREIASGITLTYKKDILLSNSVQRAGITFWVSPERSLVGMKVPLYSSFSSAIVEGNWMQDQNNKILQFNEIKPYDGLSKIMGEHQVLKIRAWPNYYECYFNDQLVYSVTDKNFQSGDIGLGTAIIVCGTIRYHNWRIRKLDSEPTKNKK